MPFLKGGSENVPVRIIKAERRSKRFWVDLVAINAIVLTGLATLPSVPSGSSEN